jgi:hypothetical protein
MAKRSSAITQAHLDSDLLLKTIVRGRETGDVFGIARQVVFPGRCAAISVAWCRPACGDAGVARVELEQSLRAGDGTRSRDCPAWEDDSKLQTIETASPTPHSGDRRLPSFHSVFRTKRYPRKCEILRRFPSRRVCAPNAPGNACEPWLNCVSPCPTALLRPAPRIACS